MDLAFRGKKLMESQNIVVSAGQNLNQHSNIYNRVFIPSLP